MKKIFAAVFAAALTLFALCGCNTWQGISVPLPSDGGDREYGERLPAGGVSELLTLEKLIDFHFNGEKYPEDFAFGELKGYGRVLDSAASEEEARENVEKQFTSGWCRTVENRLNVETELFYGMYAKWAYYSQGTDFAGYLDENVVCFKKDVYDYSARRFGIKDGEKIKKILDYVYYAKTRDIGGYKVYQSGISQKDGKLEYVIYLLEVCYGDWGMQDSLTFVKEICEINSLTGETATSRNVVGWASVDGKNTHGGKIY